MFSGGLQVNKRPLIVTKTTMTAKIFLSRLTAVLLFLSLVSLLAACSPTTTTSDQVPVQILAFNDFHGQIIPGQKLTGRDVGSAPVLAAYLNQEQQDFPGPTFVVHAGDLVGASPPASSLLQDEPAVMFFNLLGNPACSPQNRDHPQANLIAAPGNHEFDEGLTELTRLIKGGNHPQGPFLQDPWQGAAFPYVAANVVSTATQDPIFPRYVIKEVDGVPLAFIGAVVRQTPEMVAPLGVADLTFLDEARAVNACLPELQARGVKAIVVLLHQGGRQLPYEGRTRPSAALSGEVMNILAQLDDEVDVVVTGHTHRFANALVPNRNGREILVTQAFSKGTAYADIELALSRTTRDVVKKSAAIVTAWADAGPGLTPDSRAAALMQAAQHKVAGLTDRKIAVAAHDLTRSCSPAGESALGNLIADAQRRAMGADFAFMNPGGIRTDIAAGEVTWGELYAVQPFNNDLVKMELTGGQIYDLLGQQFPPHQTSPRMLQVSGLTYTWDARDPQHPQVVEVRRDNKPLDKKATYTVTVNNFLAQGGDKFTVLTQGAHQTPGPIDLDALITYIQSLPQPFTAKIEGRIKRLP